MPAPYGITQTGFSRKDLTEVLDALNTRVQGVFGLGINISPQSPQGQINGIFAEAEANLWEAIQAAYDSFNPQAAAGIVLSNLVTINGIIRKPATKSTVTLTCTGVNGTVIPVGTLFASTSGIQWQSTASATISAGTATVYAEAVDYGPVVGLASTITTIVNAIGGLDTVTNAASASPGTDVETDADLRVRRANSVAFASQSMVDSLYAGIANLPGVNQAIVLENDTDTVNADGLQPHSIHAIVDGGVAADIAAEIFKRKPVGIYTNGSTSVEVVDTQGIAHSTRFTSPAPIAIVVVVNLVTGPTFPADGVDQIKKAIVAFANGTFTSDFKQRIGDDVFASRYYTPVNSVGGHYVASMTFNGGSSVAISIVQRASFTEGNITVNV